MYEGNRDRIPVIRYDRHYKYMRLLDVRKTNTVVEGRAKTGEVSPKGLVTHVESGDGTVSALAQPAPMHYVYNDDGEIRPMTMPEMIDKGYFIIGNGPR